jgi:release factor glutamine methyltransferase
LNGDDRRRDAGSWRALRADVEGLLAAAVGDSARAEARWIVLAASGCSEAELLVDDDEPVPALAREHVRSMVERRIGGEPLQYVLGSWSFRGIDLMVDPRVLIPRPETEMVAEIAIAEVVRRGARRGRANPWAGGYTEYAVADLGTGSGAIALALASELPDAGVWATDVDARALAVARANLSSIGVAARRIRLAEGDWFGALPVDLRGSLSLVVSNPPYISTGEYDSLPVEVVGHEPAGALVSGPTGREHLETLVSTAVDWLAPGASLVLELAPHQAPAVEELARRTGYVDVEVRDDLAGRPRALVARMRG